MCAVDLPEGSVTSRDHGFPTTNVVPVGREIVRKEHLRPLLDERTLPFVRMFYGFPSQYLWDDDDGVTHPIPQGEGGEQGDAMMPLMFLLGQHEALQSSCSHFSTTS